MSSGFRCGPLAALFSLAAFPNSPVQAQSELAPLVSRLAAMTAVSGYEGAMTDTLLMLLPGAVRDRAGNVVLDGGGSGPRTLVVCPLDEAGYVVGGIRADGYLTLRRVGPGGARLDQYLAGQRVTVFGRRGAVPGVVGVRSVHLTRGRDADGGVASLDDAYVDIGAGSAAEVMRLGIEVLSPVARTKAPQHYGTDLVAGPAVARRAACAALATAARAPLPPDVVVAFAVEQRFTGRGLATLLHERGPFARTILVDGEAAPRTWGDGFGAVETWLLPVHYLGSPAETTSLADVQALAQRVERLFRGRS
jgi:putative aminopeptidase FrvX